MNVIQRRKNYIYCIIERYNYATQIGGASGSGPIPGILVPIFHTGLVQSVDTDVWFNFHGEEAHRSIQQADNMFSYTSIPSTTIMRVVLYICINEET